MITGIASNSAKVTTLLVRTLYPCKGGWSQRLADIHWLSHPVYLFVAFSEIWSKILTFVPTPIGLSIYLSLDLLVLSLSLLLALKDHIWDYVYPYFRPPSSPHKNRWLSVVPIERISPSDCLSVPLVNLQCSISSCLLVLSHWADLLMTGAWEFSSLS